MRIPWTESHDRLIRDAAPAVPVASDAELERLRARVGRSVEIEDPPARRWGRIAVGAVVGVAVLATSGVAAAELHTARTGRGPADADDLRLGGPGEKLALAAPDYGRVVAEETADIPFPTPGSRALAVRQQVDDARGSEDDSFVSTGAVRAWVAGQALCSWSNQWAVATRSGDDAGRAEAIGMIQAAPAWPAVTAIDPEPYSRMETSDVSDGKGHTRKVRSRDDSQFFYLRALGEAVEGRDPDAVARVLAAHNGYCDPANVPDLPRADPLHGER